MSDAAGDASLLLGLGGPEQTFDELYDTSTRENSIAELANRVSVREDLLNAPNTKFPTKAAIVSRVKNVLSTLMITLLMWSLILVTGTQDLPPSTITSTWIVWTLMKSAS